MGSIYPFPILTQYLIEQYKDLKLSKKSPLNLHLIKSEKEITSDNGVKSLSKINIRYK